jgi:pimeloyl-ACP methyl ester carboxylesterase
MWIISALLVALAAILVILFLITLRLKTRSEALVPPAGQLVHLPSGTLHIVEMGNPSAPAVLLVHGLGRNLLNLIYGLGPILASSCRVLAVDRSGSGYSPPMQSDDFLTSQTRQLSELLDSSDVSEVVVVGHSLGAAVALSLAELRPDKVRGVALITPIVAKQDVPPVFQNLIVKSAVVRRLVAWTLAIPLSTLRGEQILQRFFKPEIVPSDYGTKGGGYLGLRPGAFIETSEELVQLIDKGDVPKWSLASTMPVAALFASDDAVLDPRIQSEGLSNIFPTATMKHVIGAGHMLPVTRPEVCAAFVNEVLLKTERGRAYHRG